MNKNNVRLIMDSIKEVRAQILKEFLTGNMIEANRLLIENLPVLYTCLYGELDKISNDLDKAA